ncbi:MAG: choice-of-anchor Q domain-containing protein [Thermoanaerobaculia bacterium]
MNTRRVPCIALIPLLLLLADPGLLAAADAVVGSGSAASCTEAALDSAVATANSGGGTITFSCGVDPVTLVLTSAKTISAFVTLDADDLVTISGGDATRHLVVSAGATATLRDLRLVHGMAAGGGAILLEATSELHLFNTAVTHNASTTDGGAIEASDAVVHAVNSQISHNQAAGAGGAVHQTGGRLDLSRVLLHGNSAGGAGGAVAIANCNQLAVLLSSWDKNAAGGDGGALDASACSGFIEQSQVVLNTSGGNGGGLNLTNGSAISLNYDTVGGNRAAEGGGLFLAAGTSSIQRQGTLSGNSAIAAGSRGGAIANLGTLLLENTTVSANSSAGSGGGLASEGSTTLRFVTLAFNQSAVGGGIASSGATLHMRNVILAGDSASSSGDECDITGGADIASSLWAGTSCGATATNGNQPATDALLAPLGFSCPPSTIETTRTHDLDPASPAINAGITLGGGNAFMDQRTVFRPQGGLVNDIGAVEYIPTACPWFFADGFERGNTFSWSNTVGD